jgi:SAM-dependent methyltransferase
MTFSARPICRVCGATESDVVCTSVSEAPESAVYRCLGCGIVHIFPIMTEAEETAFYRSEFERYMGRRSDEGWQSPADRFRASQAEGERRLPLVRPFLRAGDEVLEIGSSTGFFLDDLKGYVRSVMGVEPGDAQREYALSRGIETLRSLEELGSRTFGVIILYYVLEHLRDPVGYLRSLHRHLTAGGRVMIEVPNVEDALLSVYQIPQFSAFYWQKAHYQSFNRETLGRVLDIARFSSDMFPVQRYDLSNHMVWMMHGKPGGHGHFKGLLTPEVETAYAEALKARWVCDTLFAVARPATTV